MTNGKIWIDLDNSPHVPFFAPIIEELGKRSITVLLTARDAFQVRELADSMGLPCKSIGRHHGKNKVAKVCGLGLRTAQLLPTVLKERPSLALSHGSRAQLMVARVLGIESVLMMDYEFARGLTLLKPSWVMTADPIPPESIAYNQDRIMKYAGIKEDVYVPRFRPTSSLRDSFGITEQEIMVTLRPPANEAHYHNPESDKLFTAVLDLIASHSSVKAVLLPRTPAQGRAIRNSRPHLFASRQIVIPERALDGLNLIWNSDLVISGGGTMNREAAALGVPVYSIFHGKIGAVDRYLAQAGRLVLVDTADQVTTRIRLQQRDRVLPGQMAPSALNSVVTALINIMESICPKPLQVAATSTR